MVLEGDSKTLMKSLIDNMEVLSYCGAWLDDVHRCPCFFFFLINYVTLMLRKKVIGSLTVLPRMPLRLCLCGWSMFFDHPS